MGKAFESGYAAKTITEITKEMLRMVDFGR